MELTLQLTQGAKNRLISELSVALESTSSMELQAWAQRIPRTFLVVTGRRGKNFGSLIARTYNGISDEFQGLLESYRTRQTTNHLKSRFTSALQSVTTTGRALRNAAKEFPEAVRADPAGSARKIAGGILGFLVGSGGIDGDGGIPDLDLLGGIGIHRSILTHSIVSGVVFETMVLSFLDLSRVIYAHLPEEHDEFWEELVVGTGEFLGALSTGVSLGISYHLAVDATVDAGGTYKDLPITLPQGAHDSIAAANAVIEGADAAERAAPKKKDGSECEEFRTFRAAAAFAKEHPYWVIVRLPDDRGFRVSKTVQRRKR